MRGKKPLVALKMAWERIGNSTRYVQKVRRGKRVLSIYLGSGAEAQKVANEVEEASKKRAAVREMKRSDQDIEALIDCMNGQAQAITADILTSAGFHNHKRQWRKKRCPKQ
jgi:hypothetical protein